MKKGISLILAVIMAFTSLAAGTAAFGASAKAVNVYISAQMGGNFVSVPTELSVSADLSDTYAAQVGYNDSSAEPTILDAAIAAHIEFMGSDFMSFAPLSVSAEGWINNFFGNGSSLSYYQNGVSANTLTQTIAEGDYIDFDFYTDTANWSDKYVSANAREVSVRTNTPTEFTFTASTWSGSTPAAGLSIKVNDTVAGVTDENGKITLSFDKINEYIITSENTMGTTPVFMPFCTVTASTSVYDYIEKQESAAAEYLYGTQNAFTVDNAYDFITLIRSGADVSSYEKGFADSVKANLDKNGGKIIVTKSVYNDEKKEYENVNSEDFGVYGAVILALKELGYSPADFSGYNIQSLLDNVVIADARPHQYYYKYAVEAAGADKAKAIIQDLIDKFYTKGKGMENYGYSCDNTCHFLITLAPYANDFAEYVNDAKSIIKTFLLEKGAFCDAQWVKEANADSTALSMAAFASVNDIKTAFSYYKLLVSNFEGKTGIFTLDGKANSYATKDGLFSLYYMLNAVISNSFETTEHIYKVTKTTPATCTVKGVTESKCALCNDIKKDEIAMLKHTPVTDKAVAATFKKAGKTEGSHCSVCGAVIKKQSAVKKLKAAKLKKVVKGKKSFTVKWKAVKAADGYQIQYSTSKKFKNKKTVTVKKAKTAKKTVKKLKSGKKYYVRIRTFKTINGNKEYSKWTKAKTVKVK